VGISRGCPKFESTRCYLRNGNSYERLILYAFSYNPSQQKPINNFGNSSHGRSQGLSKLSRSCTCTAHRAVTFAIAWLSCYLTIHVQNCFNFFARVFFCKRKYYAPGTPSRNLYQTFVGQQVDLHTCAFLPRDAP